MLGAGFKPAEDWDGGMETERYHLRELEIARDPGADGHLMPPITPVDRTILDIGCGAGQTLIASRLTAEQCATGIDIDEQALALGRRLDQSIVFVRAQAEHLPLPSDRFDLVISRVALPYTDIPRAAAEIGRVLRRGGRCWLVLHPMSMGARAAAAHLARGEVKGCVFQLYALLNGACLHLFGRQFRFPFSGGRPMESCQTWRGVARALRGAGLVEVQTHRDRHFVVTAKRS